MTASEIAKRVICWIAAVFTAAFVPFVAVGKTSAAEKPIVETEKYKVVLSLWNIDVFEGGKGSRTEFISDVLRLDGGVLVLASPRSEEGARSDFQNGVVPDLVSFGPGCDFVAAYARSLPFGSFAGGAVGGKTYAVPWCLGGYFLISKKEIDGHIDRLIVSNNRYSLPLAALFHEGVEAGETVVCEPKEAFSRFIAGEGVLLGTQRDVNRLEGRGTEFFSKPLEKFDDLVQYVAVTATDEVKYRYAVAAAERLCSAGTETGRIGMLAPAGGNAEGALGSYDPKATEYTVGAFVSPEAVGAVKEALEAKKFDPESAEMLKSIEKHL